METIELLSPVGDFSYLKYAINNGANAVYLGLNNFGARGNIENFTKENLKDAVDLAHLYNVKVYVTLNTLIKDCEFDEVLNSVKFALNAGVDAFIVQDIGLCYFLRKHFPNIELHASTQMGIQNLEGVQAIENLGFTRVVLARETPLSEIKRISNNSNIDIEYFIQGALCVAFSGNCYLCSLLANSSGNRGKCKQFCRLPYNVENGNQNEQGYLLSTKDFCMLPYLKQLADSGVTSFKIEGRARRQAYVAVATSIYRKAIDNNFRYSDDDILALKKVYNRGNFISGYFANEKIIYPYAQNHIGVSVGKVVAFSKGKKFNEITIKSNHHFMRGDVIKFFVDKIEHGIITIMDVKQTGKDIYLVTTTANVPNGSEVRLVVDNNFETNYLNVEKKIDVDVTLSAKIGQKANLTMKANSIEVNLSSDYVVPQAKTSPLSQQDCENQFSKMGENFSLKSLTLNIENVFLSKSQLNELRRSGIELLKNKIIENYNKLNKIQEKLKYIDKNIEIIDKKNNKKEIFIFDDFDKLKTIEIQDNYLLIYRPYNFSENSIKNYYENYKKLKIYISLPIIILENELSKIKEIIAHCENWGIVANNYYALNLCEKDKIIIGSSMNVYNSYSVKYYADLGYKNIILSKEDFDLTTIKNRGINLYCLSDYCPEYMYFRHCPFKEHLNSSCERCNYRKGVVYKLNNNTFDILRQKIFSCQFILKSHHKIHRDIPKKINKAIEL